jgi:uncharacterized small protein (DUF1192 family)
MTTSPSQDTAEVKPTIQATSDDVSALSTEEISTEIAALKRAELERELPSLRSSIATPTTSPHQPVKLSIPKFSGFRHAQKRELRRLVDIEIV